MLRLPLRRRTVTAHGISLLLLLLLLFLLRRRTIPSPPCSHVRRSHPSSLFPLSSQLSRFPDTILLLPLSPVHRSPPPLFPDPSPSTSSHPPPPPSTPTATSTIPRLLRSQHSPLRFPTPDPTAPSPVSCSGADGPHLPPLHPSSPSLYIFPSPFLL
ncbi:unnamed protein product, partial [Musa textilis]